MSTSSHISCCTKLRARRLKTYKLQNKIAIMNKKMLVLGIVLLILLSFAFITYKNAQDAPVDDKQNPCDSAPSEHRLQCEQMNAWLDQKLVEWKPAVYEPMMFGTMNNLLIYGISYEIADEYEKAVEETNVDFVRMDIPKLNGNTKPMEDLGKMTKSIQGRGKKVMILNNANGDKMYFGDGPISWNQYSEKQKEFVRAAASFRPEYITVAAEPSVASDFEHERRLSFAEVITPDMWVKLISEMAVIAMKESPGSKIAISIMPQNSFEQSILKGAVNEQNIDIVGLNVYGPESFEAMNNSIIPEWRVAKISKELWLIETWLGFEGSEDQPWKKDLDSKWVRTMAYYSQQNNISGMNLFFSKHFFAYEKDTIYNMDEFREAIKTQRTPAFYAYKSVIEEIKNNAR